MNILILGYYDELNKNDNLYEFLFKKLFHKYNIYFSNPYQINEIPYYIDYLVCGGGEVIDEYFLAKIYSLKNIFEKNHYKKLLIYGISIETSYKTKSIISNVNNGLYNINKNYNLFHIDVFDYIITRSKSDFIVIKNLIGDNHVKFLPDIVNVIKNYKNEFKLSINLPLQKKIIIMFLYMNNKAFEKYDNYVDNFIYLIKLFSDKYIIHLITYNSTSKFLIQDNLNLYNDIYIKLPENVRNVTFIKKYTIEKLIVNLNKRLYKFAICMRYHSHILCYLWNIPFVSIPLNENVIEFMKDKNLTKYIEPILYSGELFFNHHNIIKNMDTFIKDYNKIYYNNITTNNHKNINEIFNYGIPLFTRYSKKIINK
jgi:hypothetical protein